MKEDSLDNPDHVMGCSSLTTLSICIVVIAIFGLPLMIIPCGAILIGLEKMQILSNPSNGHALAIYTLLCSLPIILLWLVAFAKLRRKPNVDTATTEFSHIQTATMVVMFALSWIMSRQDAVTSGSVGKVEFMFDFLLVAFSVVYMSLALALGKRVTASIYAKLLFMIGDIVWGFLRK
jgi:hypothetical protein